MHQGHRLRPKTQTANMCTATLAVVAFVPCIGLCVRSSVMLVEQGVSFVASITNHDSGNRGQFTRRCSCKRRAQLSC